MKRLLLGLAVCFSLAVGGCSSSSTSGSGPEPGDGSGGPAPGAGGNADKIVGNWTMVGVGGQKAQHPFDIEYTWDGKVKSFFIEAGGTEFGAYKLEGETFTETFTKKDGTIGSEISTIKKLDGDTLVLFNVLKRLDTEYKRKKK